MRFIETDIIAYILNSDNYNGMKLKISIQDKKKSWKFYLKY